MLVQPLHPRIVGPQSEACVEFHLLLVSVVGVVVEVVGEMEVEHVLLPVRLPRAELNNELWRVVVATTIELAMSVMVMPPELHGRDQSHHDASRSPARSVNAVSSRDGAIIQSSLLQD